MGRGGSSAGGGGKGRSTGGGGGGAETGLTGETLTTQTNEVMATARQMAGRGGDGKPAVLNEKYAENALKGGWNNIPNGSKLMDLPGRQIIKTGPNEISVNGKKITPNQQQKEATLRSYAVTKVVQNAKYSL